MEDGRTTASDAAPAILVVDDAVDNRRIAGAILRAAGWQVDEADDGRTAIAAVRRQAYALVLLDIQMPVLDGYQTAEAMRSEPGHGGRVPIVAFTALRDEQSRARAIAAGMDGHLAKPFTPTQLIAAVKPWWPDGAGAAIDRLAAVFGPAEIDGLLGRLADQLADALRLTIADPDLRGTAHRLAGLSGTLGFAALSHEWLAVSEGDDSALDAARVATRKALAGLAAREASAAES
jgi:CheY-like chemotaxis protein